MATILHSMSDIYDCHHAAPIVYYRFADSELRRLSLINVSAHAITLNISTCTIEECLFIKFVFFIKLKISDKKIKSKKNLLTI